MRIIAKLLFVIVVLCALGAGYVLWASDAALTAGGYQVVAAADSGDQFEKALSDIANVRDNVTLFTDETPGGADQYVFVTYTIRVRNADLVPFEWIDLSVRSKEGDVLLVKPAVQDIPALNQSLLSFTLMAQRGLIDYERQATLSYYVYGHYRQVPVTLK